MGPKCDCVCELVEDSQASSKSVSDGEEDERRHARVLEGTKENKRVDWRVLEHDSGIAEEDIGMIRRDNEVCYSGMDFSKACGIQRDDQQILSKKTHVGSTTSSGPKDRAKLSDVIEIGGHQRKVRQLFEILTSEVPPEDIIVTTKGVPKRGRVRPKTKNIESDRVVNGSLSDSDFFNRKKVILKEAEEIVQLGKLIGAAPKGNE
ncbi:hypothetical protein V6N13_001665 [Hibiscus sabdariffa]